MLDILVDNFNLENTKEYILSIQINLGGFSFCIISPDGNRLVAWKNTPQTITDSRFLARRVEEWLQTEEIFSKEYRKVIFLYDTNDFTPVPQEYYNEAETKIIIGTLFNIDNDTEIVVNQITNQNLRLLFTVPKQLLNVISVKFQNLKIQHSICSLLEQLPEVEKNRTGLILLFSSKSFHMVLFKEQKLILTNSFNLSHSNDIIFYALSVLKQYNVTPDKTEVFVTGEIDGDKNAKEIIEKYFSSVKYLVPEDNIQINTTVFQEPLYQLYPLINSLS